MATEAGRVLTSDMFQTDEEDAHLWDLKTGEMIQSFDGSYDRPWSLTNELWMQSRSEDRLTLYDVKTGEPL